MAPEQTGPREGIILRRPLAAYFVVAFALSWLVELALVASQRGWLARPVPFSLHYLASYGPAVAGILVTGLTVGKRGLSDLLGRVLKWRVGWGWILISTTSPAALFVLGLTIARIASGDWPDVRDLGQVNYLPYLGIGALPFWFLTYGLGEEIGWRGYALPRLQRTRTAASATLILGLLWALWHVPAFFYLDTYEQLGLVMLPAFALSVLCGAVVYTWLYNSTGGSVLIVALFHAVFNFFSASDAGQGIVQIVMTAGIIVAALVIPRRYGLEHFSTRPRHSL
jgi:membrane protease YdiL (CAAX protease family)